jgi:hypothetical protein
MEKSKDPLLSAIEAAFGIANSLLQGATAQVKSMATPATTETSPEIDFDVVIEREGLVRQDELVMLRNLVVELKGQVSELQAETKKLKKKLKELKEDR